MEGLGVLHRQFDAFLELLDRIAHPANVGPADLGDLNHDFAHCRRLDPLERGKKILAPDIELVEHFGRDRSFVEIDLGHDPAHRIDRRLARQRRDIGADEAIGRARQFAKIDPVAQGHAARVDTENLAPPLLVGDADHDLAIEAARTAQRLVDGIGSVGGRDDHEVRTRLQPVHQCEQLGDEALFGFAGHAVALGCDRIDLVDKDDAGRVLARLLEHFAQRLFALAIARTHDLGSVDGEEIGIAFVSDRLREPRLAGAWRSVQQHALRRIHTQPGEQFRIAQRQFNHFAQLLDGFLHPADIVVIDHRARIARRLEFGAQLDLGILVDMDDALGAGRHDAQPDLGERIGGRVEHAAHFGGHVLHRLLAGGRHEVARYQRLAEKVALERLCRTLQPHLALRGGEDDTGRGPGFGHRHAHMFARPDFGIAALKPIEPDDIEALVFVIGSHGDRRGRALAGDFDQVALGDPQRLECGTRHARNALSAFFLPRRCNLQPHCGVVWCGCSVRIGH